MFLFKSSIYLYEFIINFPADHVDRRRSAIRICFNLRDKRDTIIIGLNYYFY